MKIEITKALPRMASSLSGRLRAWRASRCLSNRVRSPDGCSVAESSLPHRNADRLILALICASSKG